MPLVICKQGYNTCCSKKEDTFQHLHIFFKIPSHTYKKRLARHTVECNFCQIISLTRTEKESNTKDLTIVYYEVHSHDIMM